MQPYSTHCIYEVVSKMSRLQQSIRFAIYPNSFAKNLWSSILPMKLCRDTEYLVSIGKFRICNHVIVKVGQCPPNPALSPTQAEGATLKTGAISQDGIQALVK